MARSCQLEINVIEAHYVAIAESANSLSKSHRNNRGNRAFRPRRPSLCTIEHSGLVSTMVKCTGHERLLYTGTVQICTISHRLVSTYYHTHAHTQRHAHRHTHHTHTHHTHTHTPHTHTHTPHTHTHTQVQKRIHSACSRGLQR